MATELRVVEISDAAGSLIEPGWLQKSESVHRQLRPQLSANYVEQISAILADGARMAVVVEGEAVVCVALWRIIRNTSSGLRLYVDDLVSDEQRRSKGAGRLLLAWLEAQGRAHGCSVLALDSGVQRQRAHRFYFREGMSITSFCFKKELK